MRHRDLEAENIRRLVQESAGLEDVGTRIGDFLDRMDKLVNERFKAHRRLSGPQLKEIWSECQSMVARDVVVIDGVVTEVPPTRTRPKGEVYEMRFVSFMKMQNPPPPLTDIYQMFSFRLRMSRRHVWLDFQGHPVGFSYHATERVLERTTANVEAMKKVATELSRSLELIEACKTHALSKTEGRLHIPFEDASGALLGEFVPHSRHFLRKSAFNKWSTADSEHAGKEERFFVARTFVDRYLLEPVQAYGLNLLSLWREEGGNGYDVANDIRCWTAGEGLAVVGDADRDPAHYALLDPIFEDRAFQRAHCRGRPEDTMPEDHALPKGRWHVPYAELTRNRVEQLSSVEEGRLPELTESVIMSTGGLASGAAVMST